MNGIFKSSLANALPLAAIVVFFAAASAQGDPVSVRSSNTHAMVQVVSSLTNTIVATPWTFYTPDGASTTNLPIDRLVRPTNLTTGDMVIALTNNVKYAAWRLVETDEVVGADTTTGQSGEKCRRWEPVTTVQRVNDTKARSDIFDGDHQDMTQQRGYGLWVYRQNPLNADGTPKPFYLYGQLASGEAKVKVYGEGAKIDAPVYTMLASPHVNQKVDINEIFPEACWKNIGADDKLIVPTDRNQHIYFLRLKDADGNYKNEWCYAQVVTERKRVGTKYVNVQKTTYINQYEFDPHIGFWYVRHSEGGDFEFTWPAPTQSASEPEQTDTPAAN